MKRKQQVFIVDDDSMTRKLLEVRLKRLNVEIQSASNGPDGIAHIREHQPDLVLLDVSMPGMDGFEVCRSLRNDPLTRDIPVIFLTGSDESSEKERGFELGAVDYVTKPYDSAELCARVRAALRTQSLVLALETQAETDALTGLPNRKGFYKAIGRALDRMKHEEAAPFAVIYLDLDGFKIINDSLGHHIGDELLVHVSQTLQEILDNNPPEFSSRGTVARLGGDEFTILVESIASQESVTEMSERILQQINQTVVIQGYHLTVQASIGIKVCKNQSQGAEEVLRDGDTAMYKAKIAGKNRFVVFDKKMHEEAMERLELEIELRKVLEREQLTLQYQPVVDLCQSSLAGFEALIRWNHPERGVIGPDKFIPIAEETGLIIPIGQWVIEKAITQLITWRQSSPAWSDLSMSINLSRVQFRAEDLVEFITSMLEKYALPAEALVFEITESVIVHDSRTVVPMMERLRALGCRLAMDDFGKGYSSLSSLHCFPLDYLKIDRQFIASMTETRAHSAVVYTIINLAENLNMQVIAEGLETREQAVQLLAMDCRYGQGYFFSRAKNAEQATAMLTDPQQFTGCLEHSDDSAPFSKTALQAASR